jgi:hypothetical protein
MRAEAEPAREGVGTHFGASFQMSPYPFAHLLAVEVVERGHGTP